MTWHLMTLPLAFCAFWILLNSWVKETKWRESFLLAVLGTNLYLVVITEVLSLFPGLIRLNVTLAWGLPVGGLGFLLLLPSTRPRIRLPKISLKNLGWHQVLILSLIGLILLVVGITSFFAPPNTPDVLNYHMPRVMHWIQNQSVRHYATGIEFQNTYPPAAEYQVLHLALLAGSDRWVNFAAWFTLLASAVCASLFAKLLKIGKTGQMLSALFTVTLPGALLLAATAKNDLHVAFWVLMTLTFMFQYIYEQAAPLTLMAAFSAIGMGFLTKTNTLLFLAPVLIWFVIAFLKQHGIKKSIHWALVAVLIFSLINAGFMIRNLQTYGTLVETYQSGRHLSEWISPRGLVSNLIRNASFHLQIPWPEMREAIQLTFLKVHVKLGIDINDPRTTNEGYFSILPINTYENFSGNTLHALLLIPLAVIYFFQVRRKKPLVRYLSPLIFSLAGFILYSGLVKWQIFGARYFLPVFFLAAPVFGAVLEKISSKILLGGLTLLLVYSSWPWVLSAGLRPLTSNPRFTDFPSIFVADRMELLLGAPAEGFPGLMRLPKIAEELDCQDIGIYGGGAATEYQIWAVLNAPFHQYRLGWIVAGSPSSGYTDPTFDPCLIICHDCADDQLTIRNFERFLEGGRFDLYRPVNNSPD